MMKLIPKIIWKILVQVSFIYPMKFFFTKWFYFIVGYAHLQKLLYKIAMEAFPPHIPGKKKEKKRFWTYIQKSCM